MRRLTHLYDCPTDAINITSDMPNYRRVLVPGGTYFFTVVTYNRRPFLCDEAARHALRDAVKATQARHNFESIAWVLLPNHLHCLWRLPDRDSDYSTRWRLIKTGFTRTFGQSVESDGIPNPSRMLHGERRVWQRRFWEHAIRDENDLRRHIDYIHYNPVKHGLAKNPGDWEFSSYQRYVDAGFYSTTELKEEEISGMQHD